MTDYNQLSKQISDLTSGEAQAGQQQYQQLQNQLGYQPAYENLQKVRRNVTETQSALNALPEQLQQRTAGTLTTSGQLARLTATESDPISKQLATLNQQQTLGQQGMADINAQLQQGMGLWSQSYQDQLKALAQQQQNAFATQQAAEDAARQKDYLRFQQQLATEATTAAQKAAEDATMKKINGLGPDALYAYLNTYGSQLSPDVLDKAWAIWREKTYGKGAGAMTQEQAQTMAQSKLSPALPGGGIKGGISTGQPTFGQVGTPAMVSPNINLTNPYIGSGSSQADINEELKRLIKR